MVRYSWQGIFTPMGPLKTARNLWSPLNNTRLVIQSQISGFGNRDIREMLLRFCKAKLPPCSLRNSRQDRLISRPTKLMIPPRNQKQIAHIFNANYKVQLFQHNDEVSRFHVCVPPQSMWTKWGKNEARCKVGRESRLVEHCPIAKEL